MFPQNPHPGRGAIYGIPPGCGMGSRLVRWCRSFLAQPPATPFDPFGIRKHGFDAVADQIVAIKDGWRLNMTELAVIMDVQRPTLYNWLNGKTSPNAEARQELDLLVAAAPVWNRLTAKSSDSFLLDYTGPDEAGPSIRQRLNSPDCRLSELIALVSRRIGQYREARARSLELLGERPQAPASSPSKAAWRLNRQWARNAKSLHRARKRAD
jgi:transcriptional regulator with XRE-family HTH domain